MRWGEAKIGRMFGGVVRKDGLGLALDICAVTAEVGEGSMCVKKGVKCVANFIG